MNLLDELCPPELHDVTTEEGKLRHELYQIKRRLTIMHLDDAPVYTDKSRKLEVVRLESEMRKIEEQLGDKV